ncbi:MAG TPA: PepSY domain-containing protein [Nitrososphaeraceae archaeon]|nr:PepSY domain-containing protein [Nitrososphaeraceae archaeon]
MKKVLIPTTLVAILAIGLLGINNNISNNINNASAQEGAITPEGMNNTMVNGSEMMKMGIDDDSMMMKLNGTIKVESTIAEAFKSKITTDIIGAIQAAQGSVGANSFVKEAELTDAHGYLVYKIKVVDENMKKYKVIVDPGNGQVLLKKEITWEDEHDKMKYGDEKRYDKYGMDGGGHDYKDGYDAKKKMMMMKDKKY